MQTVYEIELFNSRNTSLQRRYRGNDKGARAYAIELSNREDVHKVVLYKNIDAWETYEKGEKTEWSYPEGLSNK